MKFKILILIILITYISNFICTNVYTYVFELRIKDQIVIAIYTIVRHARSD